MNNPEAQPTKGAEWTDEREAFEAHMRRSSPKRLILPQWEDGTYKHHQMQQMWIGWQARALLSSAPSQSAEPAASYTLLRAAAKDFYNKTIADTDVRISSHIELKRDAAVNAAEVLRAALIAAPPDSGYKVLDDFVPVERTFLEGLADFIGSNTNTCSSSALMSRQIMRASLTIAWHRPNLKSAD